MRILQKDISREALKYLAVGAIGYLIDVSIFNLLSWLESNWTNEDLPLLNKTISSLIAISFTYLANSRWTFRGRTGSKEGVARVLKYGVVNLLGLLITLIPLFVSRYVLGFDSLLADNISANIIGTGLALGFRFLMARRWVFIE